MMSPYLDGNIQSRWVYIQLPKYSSFNLKCIINVIGHLQQKIISSIDLHFRSLV